MYSCTFAHEFTVWILLQYGTLKGTYNSFKRQKLFLRFPDICINNDDAFTVMTFTVMMHLPIHRQISKHIRAKHKQAFRKKRDGDESKVQFLVKIRIFLQS